jgi:hypothetical protein
MAYTTLPGVRVSIADGFYAANDATVDGFADRVLIVAKAASGTNAELLRDPSRLWKGESEVISAFGRASDVHVAFNAAVKGGAGNIFISATDPNPSLGSIPEVEVAGATLTDLTEAEYELYRALEQASLANPAIVVLYGYPANETIDIGATERLAYYAPIATQACEHLTSEVETFEDWYNKGDVLSAKVDGVSLGTGIATQTIFMPATSAVWSPVRTPVIKNAGTPEDHVTIKYDTWIVRFTVAPGAGKVITSGPTGATPCGTALAAQTTFTPVAEVDWSTAPKIWVDGVEVTTGFAIEHCSVVTFAVAPGVFAITADNVYAVTTDNLYGGAYPVSASNVKSYIDWLVGTDSPPASSLKSHNIQDVLDSVETTGNDTGLSKYLVLTVGDVQVSNQTQELDLGVSEYIAAGPVVAGNIYSLALDKALTMKPLVNVTSLAFDMTPTQKLSLINKGCVPLGVSPVGLLVAVDGVTAAIADTEGNTSVYNRLSSLRIVHEVVRGTRGELEPFIGTTATTARLNSIETKLRSYYMALKQNELAKEIRFEMRYSITSSTLSVTITVMPFGEIRDIEVTVDVQLQ